MRITLKHHHVGKHTIFIPVPDTYTCIGLAMSGGMDSTLLAKLLLPFLDHSKVTVYTVDLKNSVQTVKSILAELGANVQHVTLADPKNPNGALSPTFLDLCKELDFFYTGITMNPPWADAIAEGQKPKRFDKVQYQNMFMPFGTSTKDQLVELFMSTGDFKLLQLTHTCTERPQGNKACGTCFACRERIWAFDQTHYFDYVTYE
jgi:7-cyano-7-deazaguanine synthase in queuosine biosynthesis